MKTCFLHLGLHKTASSSFQQTCAWNRKTLGKQGFHYPLFACEYSRPKRLKINNHSVPLRCLYDQNPKNYHINKRWKINRLDEAIRDYDAQLTEALSRDASIILSGEGLSLLSGQALSQLVERIRAEGFVICPLALVRSPLDYAHSIAQQLIRGGQHLELVGCGPLLVPQPMKRLTIPDGQRELAMLRSVFGEDLQLVPFRRACAHSHGPVGYLLEEFCSVSNLELIKFQNSQESKSNGWVRVQNLINRRWPIFDPQKQLNPDHFRLQDDLASTGKFRLTRTEVDLLKDQLAQSNQAMVDLLSEEFVLADDSVSDELTVAEVSQIITDLARSTLSSSAAS
ncbi:hypothetical protein [Synechococcus sp. N32]|uniref:hypothetical protein n=1 Tax=Synechococcus sp. N32 TaxID=2575514 RepID=UPI0010BD5439|nr:hypothetical protein [Synechococcus sp. N32]